ncbi:MAG TPA: UpxY family transcription antiterminator [Terracidiphilus sp.]|nr:UpxY family transcription antiterminator [Terracidiphilus sp.]
MENALAIKDSEALSCGALSSLPGIGRNLHVSTDFNSSCAPEFSAAWFALYTVPRHEKQVHRLLLEKQIEAYLPLYRAQRHWQKRNPIVLDLPLFPNYIFVRIARPDRRRVLAISGALSLVGSNREAWPLEHNEIEALQAGLHLRKPEPHPYLAVGERVRITRGSMSGLEGVLVRKKNDFRVVLSLDQIMCSVSVEVDATEIEPVATLRRNTNN